MPILPWVLVFDLLVYCRYIVIYSKPRILRDIFSVECVIYFELRNTEFIISIHHRMYDVLQATRSTSLDPSPFVGNRWVLYILESHTVVFSVVIYILEMNSMVKGKTKGEKGRRRKGGFEALGKTQNVRLFSESGLIYR